MMVSTPAILHGRRCRRVRHRWLTGVGLTVAAAALLATLLLTGGPASAQRRWTIAFANATEEPGVTLEGTGFTGAEVRESFNLAARPYPIDMVFYDNRRD